MSAPGKSDMLDVFTRALIGADRVIVQSRNALGADDAHYLHAPTLLAALNARAALDPAPDHAEWDAAIEAAAKVALDQEVACWNWFMQTGHHCNVYEQLPIVAADIRALKKGQTND